MKIFYNKILYLSISLLIANSLFGQQEQIRIMAYNILEYWNTSTMGDSASRDPYFKIIIDATNPDILAAIELNSEANANTFLRDVLNKTSVQYKMGTFVSNYNASDVNVIYFKPDKFTFISSDLIISSPTDTTNHPTYEHQFYNNLTGSKLIIYNVHFTSGSSNTDKRDQSASFIRSFTDILPSGSNFIAMGDFNFYKGGLEPAFTTLLSQTNPGYFIDPLNLPNTNDWTTSPYYPYHTLATRLEKFGGSNESYGLKYRSDLILNSQSVVDIGGVYYNPNSFVIYENDGQHHLHRITDPPVIPSGQTIAEALYYASDHLPVYADYTFSTSITTNPPYPGSIVFTQVGVAGANNYDVIEFMTLYRMNLTTLKITNNHVLSDGSLSTGLGAFDLSNTPWTDVPGGTFIRLSSTLTNDNNATDRILQYNGTGSGTLPILNSGGDQLIAYTGSSPNPTYYIAGIHWGDSQGWTSASNPPGTPSDIELTGNKDNCYYSANINSNLYGTRNSLTQSVNWAQVNPWPGYQDLRGMIGNGALPVELAYFSGSINGDKVELQWRTETEVNNYGFEAERSQDKNSFERIGFVQGHGNSNSPKEYSLTDEFPPSGKIYYRLKQIDNDGQYEYSKIIEVENIIPSEIKLSQNYPNPFNPETSIDYTISVEGYVSINVYDILGREVATLLNEEKAAGKYSVKFNGSRLTSGVYIYTLKSGNQVLSGKMSLLK